MRITAEFSSVAEMQGFAELIYIAGMVKAETGVSNGQLVKKEAPAPEKKEAPTPAPENDGWTPVKDEDVPEQFREPEKKAVDITDVRKLLAQVNKKLGNNIASQWISEVAGVEKLTDVKDADTLAALKAKAEGVLNG